jgi:hypothetical protein
VRPIAVSAAPPGCWDAMELAPGEPAPEPMTPPQFARRQTAFA